MDKLSKFVHDQKFLDFFEETVIQLSPIKNSFYRRNCKYTPREYLEEIVEVLTTGISWRQHKGKINGRVLNNKHNEFVKLGIYDALHQKCLEKYIRRNKTKKIKYQSIDSTFIKNEYGVEKQGRNKLYKNKKGVKISAIVDTDGVPLGASINPSNQHDSQLIDETLDSVKVKLNTKKYKNHNRYKQYFLADAGYCSIGIRNRLMKRGYIPVIAHNKRNTKKTESIKKFNKREKEIYKKRIVVENLFSWVKKAPKIKHFYEKTVASYKGLLLLRFSMIIFNRIS